jgi:inhibitor of KinA
MNPPRCLPLGDSALTLIFGDTINLELHRRVLAVARRLALDPPRAVREVVPAYTTISVWFDPLERDAAGLTAELLDVAARTPVGPEQRDGREWRIPVRYDGPDLGEVADTLRLSVDEVIHRHSRVPYRVFLLGFVPGFAFLGLLDPSLVLPRRAAPRPKVPAGSVAIAGVQTAVYPIETPGGWHLLGSTGLALFDPRRDSPALLEVGDTVRFDPVP